MSTHMKIKKGDTVLVAKGKDRGKQGKVTKVMPKTHKIIVDGVNQRIRHTRPKKQGEKGQRVTVTHAIHVANVMVVCSSCGKGTRVGFQVTDNAKVRVCKKCKSAL